MAGSAQDLTTLEAVKIRAEVTSNKDDVEIQDAITGFSQWFLDRSGFASLNSVNFADEFYDGNGNNRLMLRNYPVVNVSAVIMQGTSLPISTDTNSWGIVVDQGRKSIALRAGGAGSGARSSFPYYTALYAPGNRGPVFYRGIQNIEVQYFAGYPTVPLDLEYAVRSIVALNYKRKGWQDQKSRAVTAAGTAATTSYRDWDYPPEYKSILRHFIRLSATI